MSMTIRPLTDAEIETAVDWAAAEGWNPGHNDAQLFAAVDPEGFLGGFLDGTMVACISAVRFPPAFGFVGFYLVRPDVRGRGYGYAVWQAAMAQLAGRVVGLDGVVDQQDNYARSGFVWADRNVRFAGRSTPTAPRSCPALSDEQRRAVAEYDRAFFPGDRRALIVEWLKQPGAHSAVAEVEGRVAGYAVARPCRTGYKVAPLFADTAEIADGLWSQLTHALPRESEIFLDVPTSHVAAVDFARSHGLSEVFETARMYQGGSPDIAAARTYGLLSFELG